MALAPGLERELPAPFQALTPWARCQPGGVRAGQLCAYSCHLSHCAGKASRLPGASKGSPEVTGCLSCPRKGSFPDCRTVTKPGTGQLPGVPREWEQETGLGEGELQQQAPEPRNVGLYRRQEPWARGGVADNVFRGWGLRRCGGRGRAQAGTQTDPGCKPGPL